MKEKIETGLKVLVSGATGNQGGAVVKALLEKGHTVRALTRNLKAPKAKALQTLGAEVVAADMNNTGSIKAALEGVDTFYLMGSPFEDGIEAETRQGIALANAAKDAGIGHLVYGSVANADLDTHIPHFDSKYEIEEHIKTLDLPYTISAPVFFMDNVISPWSIDALKAGKIVQAMPGSVVLQQVSVKNIGEFVASLISRRGAVFGKRFDIAGDALSGQESASILTHTTEHSIRYEEIPLSVLREQSEDMATMYDWFVRVGYQVDITALHDAFNDVPWQNYRQWTESMDWKILD